MSTLTHLSDADLDAVTGGVFNFASISIARNFSVSPQSQTNVAILAIAEQGGNQTSTTNQVAVAG